MPARYRFQPRLATTLAAVAVLALTLAAAWWQLGRAHEKEAVAARLQAFAGDPPIRITATEVEARDVEWRRVTARGRFDPGRAVLIDNRIHRGIAGYHVVMPLALDGGKRYVLVNRGWIAGTRDRGRLPEVTTPADTVEITGRAVAPSARFLELAPGTAEGRVWQNLTLERYRKAIPVPLQPFMILQESPLEDGLTREWSPPDLGVGKHYGYAFQWFLLALTVIAFYLATHVKRHPQA